jgi:capsule polysaccharide export protein KpsE/RkpR
MTLQEVHNDLVRTLRGELIVAQTNFDTIASELAAAQANFDRFEVRLVTLEESFKTHKAQQDKGEQAFKCGFDSGCLYSKEFGSKGYLSYRDAKYEQFKKENEL